MIGARPFLIAWNINLNTNNQRKAEKIAATIRDKGSYVRDEKGELKRGEDGKPFRAPGMFRHLNAIGWTIDEYGFCQISCNVLDFTGWAYTQFMMRFVNWLYRKGGRYRF